MNGRKKNVGPQNFLGGRNIFFGGRKRYLAAEHHNEAAPKKKKKPRFFRLGAEKYDFRAPKEQRPSPVQELHSGFHIALGFRLRAVLNVPKFSFQFSNF